MQITTSAGTMILNDDASPSVDDMNDIIASLTSDDAEFQSLCDASTSFPEGLTNAQFESACMAWLAKQSGFYFINSGSMPMTILAADSPELADGVPSSSDWFATRQEAEAARNEAIAAE